MRNDGASTKAGYCSICHSPNLRKYNERIKEGWKVPALDDLARTLGDKGWSRQTWYSHKRHYTAPVKFVDDANKGLVVQGPDGETKKLQIRKGSNQEFLETVRDIGLTKALNDPGSITIEQALKATQILEGKKAGHGDSVKVLIGIVTGHKPSYEVIDGEAVEVS